MKFAIVLLAAFALLLAGCTGNAPQPAQQNNTTIVPPVVAPPVIVPPAQGNNTTATTPSGITLAQLALHNKETDCWVGYDGKAYDITAFIPNHKNYRMLIVPLCGTADQFKAKFEGKHGTSKVGILESQPLMGTLVQ